MPYLLTKSIDLDMAHHISGHEGACINLHGHTWKFEVGIEADVLDETGFVVDFKTIKTAVLQPVHAMLDHALLLSEEAYEASHDELCSIGRRLLATRKSGSSRSRFDGECLLTSYHGQIRSAFPGGMKMAVSSFAPTSERLAGWLFGVASQVPLNGGRCKFARVYETLHPVNSIAEFSA